MLMAKRHVARRLSITGKVVVNKAHAVYPQMR
ncbi:hypothetical protein HNR10_000684 [Nocardiopsis aegyptia]|uniref:Uncharacterized protein n=1 Tax=Nocardiopsis aegyptia TaxID=220378 RepID=A0A7Z0EK79_9ACTN|nr:hypothetical protein [Nocardiopsis aegyptia]